MQTETKSCRVLVTPTTFGKSDPRLRQELEAAVGEVIYNELGRPLTSEEVRARLAGIDGYIAGLDTVDRGALAGADRLKVIARYGVGVDQVDLESAARKSIVVTNTPHANSASVAELTIGLIVALARLISQNSAEVRQGTWPRARGVTIGGKTVGLLGFGSIGKEVARRLQGWSCRVIAYDPKPDHAAARELGVDLTGLNEVVAESDFLSLHLPVSQETRGMVNAEFLSRMKHGAFLINTARGELVDEVALAAAIESGHLRGAALDTLSKEPPLPENCLCRLPQVIITPHCGAHTDGAMDAMGWGSLLDCLAVLRGEDPAHPLVPKPSVTFQIKTRSAPTMYFIGVTTVKSSIMKVFPLWMRELGRPDVHLEGVDLQLHDSAENYRAAVAQIKYDPLSLGALVTGHKINLLEASRDLFDYLDPYAVICGEVSSVSKNGSALEGHAKDPITAGMSLDSLLGSGYFGRTRGEVLCLGAGGSTTAIVLHFAQKQDGADRPRRIVLVNRSPGRLEKLRAMLAQVHSDIAFEYHCNSLPEVNDEIVATLQPYSLVINATGMGKDLPGSPLTDRAIFPMNGIAWELNYRGELDFLHQALGQRESRRLTIEDGWLYFLHGWTQVIAQVLKVPIEGVLFGRLAEIAGRI